VVEKAAVTRSDGMRRWRQLLPPAEKPT